MKTVWITRTQPGATATAARVRAMGHDPVVAPLLAVVALGDAPIALDGVTALAFTSANGVRAFAARSDARSLPVYVVGPGTAAAARAAGFSDICAADGGVEALAALLTGRRIDGVILHPGALHPAGDLVGALAKADVSARGIAVYDTIAQPPPPQILARLATLDAILVHSAKAARCLATVLRGTPTPGLDIICLSPQVREALADGGERRALTAATPSEDALLSLL